MRALWLALKLALSPQLAAAQSGLMVDPPPPDPGYVELAHDDPSIPARMQVLLAQTQGVGDRNLPETTEIAPEPIATGDLISVQFEYSRSGAITADYRTRTILTGSISIPAGTPIYASIFQPIAPNDLPLRGMWCAAGYDGPVTDVGERGVCFAGANDRAAFFPIARAQSPYAVRSFDMRNVHSGRFPQIEERPLEAELRRYIVIDSVEPTRVSYHIEEGEAQRRSTARSGNVDIVDGEGVLEFEGGSFTLRVDEANHVSATALEPIEARDTTLNWTVFRDSDGRFVMGGGPYQFEIDGERERFVNLADRFRALRRAPQPPQPQ